MNLATRLFLLSLLASPARATLPDFELPSLTEYWAARAAWEGRRASRSRAEIPTRRTWADVNACWTREPRAEADALGLPSRVCLRRFGVAVPVGYELPFHDGSALLVEGEPASGAFHVSGGARRSDGWDIVGSILERRAKERRCGSINAGFVTVEAPIDARGNAQAGPLRVYGHLMDSSARCREPAKGSYFEYRREP